MDRDISAHTPRWVMPILKLKREIVYGPLFSRRLGRSLGVNILPPERKVCSFDCVYCHSGATDEHTLTPAEEGFPTIEKVLADVEEGLRTYPYVDFLTFSGNGEPTLHPQFPTIAAEVRRLRDAISPRVKLALFSNATTAVHAPVRAALEAFDMPMMKLDAGDPGTFSRVNRPCRGVDWDAMVQALAGLPHLTVQSVLINGPVSNVRGEAYAAWRAALAALRPAHVQIYSTDYPVPEAGVRKVPPPLLKRIAAEVEEQSSVSAQAYWF
jgi:wyosine [tRNA(Phe)-imidazoG37] synthetase (radical SAM superfamily)